VTVTGALAAPLAVAVAWLVWVVVGTYRSAPVLGSLLDGLGTPLPDLTRALLATYRCWWLAPALSVALAIDVLRRPAPSLRYFSFVLAGILLLAFALQAWSHEAFFGPLFRIIEAIG
jgi:hypothetical protein